MADSSPRRRVSPAQPASEPATVPASGEPPTVQNFGADKDLPQAAPALGAGSVPTRLPARFGRYRLERVLGKGGMGAVYLAYDSQLDRQVALKIPHFSHDEVELRERFFREARAAATLDHPNLCPVFDIGEQDGVYYLTMAYIEGKSLSEYLRSDKLFTPKVAAGLVRVLALALQEAHDRGVIHRDLKPANILIKQKKKPVITDFGLARRSSRQDERLTQSGAIMGTPAYMSPEQVNGDANAMGPGCDIYALGVILYELLTGRPPFEGPMGLLMAQIALDPPPPLTEFRPDLDPVLEAICLKALAKRPQDRYRSMKAFAEALESWLAGTASRQPVLRAEEPELLEALPADDTLEEAPRPVRSSRQSHRPSPRQGRPMMWVLVICLVCFFFCVVPLGGIITLIYVTVNKVSEGAAKAGKYFGDLQKKQKGDFGRRQEEQKKEEQQLEKLARKWKAPPVDAGPDRLFPDAVGDYRLAEHDTKADVADLNVVAPGQRAIYQGPAGNVEVFVYRASRLEKEAILRRVTEALTPRAFTRLMTGGANIRGSAQSTYFSYSLEATPTEGAQSGTFWWQDDWLFLLRTTTAEGPGPFLGEYLTKLAGESGGTATAPATRKPRP